jgi:hypothetical protein
MMRECRNCRFPLKFARFFEWRSDGTILNTDSIRTRSHIVILELGETNAIFNSLAEKIGVPVDPILITAEKNVGKAFFQETILRTLRFAPENPRLRPSFVAKMMVRQIRTNVAGLGSGIISADYYKGGDSMILRFKNPSFLPRLVGTSLGIYESIERLKCADYDYWIDGNGDLLIKMSHPEGENETSRESRLYLDDIKRSAGPLIFERCPGCGVPLGAAGALEWHIEEGTIINRFTGRRETVGAVQSVNAMMRELEKELGGEVLEILYQAQKEYAEKQLEGLGADDREKLWDRYLFDMALRGMGYPDSFERGEGTVSVEIHNAYNQTLYAGKVAALFELLSGGPSTIEWDHRERTFGSYSISS